MMTQMQLFDQSPVPWKPHVYQKKAMKFLLEHAAAALFLDPGLGKTSITLGAFKVLKKKGLAERALLVAPLRVCYSVWPNEQAKWKDFQDLKLVILHGREKDTLLQHLLKPTKLFVPADIYTINPEGLEWLLDVTKVKSPKTGKTKIIVDTKRVRSMGFDTLIIDELSKFKHTSSNRWKALKEILSCFKRRWGLTGSPASNGLEGLFGQCYVLDHGKALGEFITHYRNQFFLPSASGFGYVIREGAEDEIYDRLAPLALRMDADDYLDLPELIINDIYVDLPDEARRVYDQLEEDLLTKIEDRVITAATAASASVKCRQVANGGIYLEPDILKLIKAPKTKREWINLHWEKIDALEELTEELQGSPLLVAYDFEHDMDRIRERFGKDIPYIGGGVTPKRSQELEKQWNAGKLPLLFGHPQSIAHGLNLQEMGNHVCWHSLTYDYENYDQFIRRVWRQGNKSRKVFVHRLIARDTVDDHSIMPALGAKQKGQGALFAALKELAKKRRRR